MLNIFKKRVRYLDWEEYSEVLNFIDHSRRVIGLPSLDVDAEEL